MTVKIWTFHGGNIGLPKDPNIKSHKIKELTRAIPDSHQQ
jgi:hypothetical protein